MSNVPTGPQAGLVGQAEPDGLAAAASSFGKLLQSYGSSTSLEQSKSVREDNAVYTDKINELVLVWLVEDLEITASVCHTDSLAVFEDLLAMIAAEAPVLHRTDPGYADAVGQLLEWFLQDIGSVARSFNLDPVDVFEDAVKVIVSGTPLADRILEARASSGTALENCGM